MMQWLKEGFFNFRNISFAEKRHPFIKGAHELSKINHAGHQRKTPD